MRLFIFSVVLFFCTSCAATQWVFRNANDRKVEVSPIIKSIDSLLLNENFLKINLSIDNKSSKGIENISQSLCLNRLAYFPEDKENLILINSKNFQCTSSENFNEEVSNINTQKNELVIFYEDEKRTYQKKEYFFISRQDKSTTLKLQSEKYEKIVNGSKAYYVLAPFTFILDVITAPIQWGIFISEMYKLNNNKRN